MELKVLGGGAGMVGRKMVYGDTQCAACVVQYFNDWYNHITVSQPKKSCFSSLDQWFSKCGHLKQQHHSILLGDVLVCVCVCVCVYTHNELMCVYTHTYLYTVCIYAILMHIRDHIT